MANKIKVLLTTPHLNTTASPWRHIEAIVRYLPKDEFDLTVCSLSSISDELALSLLQKYHARYFVSRFRPLGGKIRGKSLFKKFQYLYEIYQESLKLYHQSLNLQHSLDYVSHPFEAILARLHRIPFIFSQRNLLEGGSRFGTRLKALLSSKVIAISEQVATLLQELGVPREKIRYIPNGIDVDSIPFSWQPPRKPIVLAVGHIVRCKGYEDALAVLKRLSEEFPEIQIKIAGKIIDHTYWAELQQLAELLGISKRVFFLGEISNVLSLMRECSVLIHCARSEGFGWVLLEAMSIGLPVVCASFQGASKIVRDGETGVLVKHGDIEGYVSAIKAILTNFDFAHRIAKRARMLVEQEFSARAMVAQIAAVYREVFEETKR